MKVCFSSFLNLVLWLNGSALAGTGLILAFRLPSGSRGGQGLSLLGWTRHDWGDLHLWLAYAAITLVVVHLWFHARWLWVVACHRSWLRLASGLALGLVLPAAALLWPLAVDGRGQGHGRGSADISAPVTPLAEADR